MCKQEIRAQGGNVVQTIGEKINDIENRKY